jgi:acyl-coenzyme A synthetase/AMP-(fatty) acid ligase
VTRCYLGDKAATAKSFIAAPAWAADHGHGDAAAGAGNRRVYETGDLVRYHPNGALVFVGRKDSQVKLLSQRLELGEAGHRLVTCLPVQNAVAVVPDRGLYCGQLVAIITLNERYFESDHRDADDSHDSGRIRPLCPPSSRRAGVQTCIAAASSLLLQRPPA